MIEINKVDYTKTDKLYDAINNLYQASHILRYNNKSNSRNYILNAIKELENEISASIKETDNRLQIWAKYLNHYYKMHTKETTGHGVSYEYDKYIYPYRITEANSMLWLLEVNPNDNYNGGVKDHNYTVDEDWNVDITLEEISKEEFEQHAIESIKRVMEHRLEGLENELV